MLQVPLPESLCSSPTKATIGTSPYTQNVTSCPLMPKNLQSTLMNSIKNSGNKSLLHNVAINFWLSQVISGSGLQDQRQSLPQCQIPTYYTSVLKTFQQECWCYDFPHFVLLVNTLTYFSYPSGSLLSQWTFSHHIWHICLLMLTFVPRFIF